MCSVCGNGKCEESEFETCTNCPKDCGECTLKNCFQIVTCALGCVQLDKDPPEFSVSCVANCVAQGCPDVQFFVDQALTCAFLNLDEIANCNGSILECAQQSCGPEMNACLGATC